MPSLPAPHLKRQNLLLSALSDDERARLLPHLEQINLRRGQVLYEPDEAIRHVHFPTGGLVSIFAVTSEGETVEIAMVGSEGVVGIPVVLGYEKSPDRVIAQTPTSAVRIRVDHLRKELSRGGRLRGLILRYTHVFILQISQSAACNRFHTVEQRLCRWLLMTRDRVRADEFNLTQEFLSHMLGVPRTSVTTVAARLQRLGLISYTRGNIRINNPRALERAACECYRMFAEEISPLLAS